MTKLVPGEKVPALEVALAGGGNWKLSDRTSRRFTIIEFYRGLHCPRCARRLTELEGKLGEFEKRDMDIIAISMDPEDRAVQSRADWGLDKLKVGYGLSEEVARGWGLYMSQSIAEKETQRFSEPGLFFVRPDGTLYMGYIATGPFLRPTWDDIVGCLDFLIERDYPARGTLG